MISGRLLAAALGAAVAMSVVATPPPAAALPMAGAAAVAMTPPVALQVDHDAVAELFDGPLPAVSTRTWVPSITGHAGADRRIASVALARGYHYRGSPLDDLGFYQGRRLQQDAIDDLVALQAAMRRDIGVGLTLTSAYRGVAAQRAIFLSRLGGASFALRGRLVSNAEIGRGEADDVLHRVMARAAPPGFSKHHTGYAIDVASGGFAGPAFRRSRAWQWLTENGFANAMRYGWIPSYPDGADDQGPNPEPWEWVWIGRDTAACGRTDSCAVGGVDNVSRRRVTGWAAAPGGAPVRRLRLVTDRSTERLDAAMVQRFDLTAAYGNDIGFSFVARARVPRRAAWACVEARTAKRGPWARVGCIELS